MVVTKSWISPNWVVPSGVKALSTTRLGGVSKGAFASLNLALHVNDEPDDVLRNRLLLQQQAPLPQAPCWLQQVHGTTVITAENCLTSTPLADAIYSNQPDQVCAVMTADCLPLLLCTQRGDEIAAIHAGWRGLCDGVIENTLTLFQAPRHEVLVWMGPAISSEYFEVGKEVLERFIQVDSNALKAFTQYSTDKYLADLYLLARQRLVAQGVRKIYGGNYCTYRQAETFFSYRRDKTTGRMASLIWLQLES